MSFQFKQFSIEDNRSTMKVGTDAVLLGSWADISKAKRILEIGCGSGVIALMLAQRTNARIDAIDIDQESTTQAKENFQNSPWSSNLKAIHSSLKDFQKSNSERFDLIISNPPFFINSLTSPYKNKALSKHTSELSYNDLIHGITHFLKPEGKACIILPYTESKIFIELARIENLYLNKELLIKPKQDKTANRILLEISYQKTEKQSNEIYLRESDNGFSADYKRLCKDYYLNI